MKYLLGILLAAACTFANAANFVSLHQSPLKIALKPQGESYEYPIATFTGFKNQYAPTGVTGCAIGAPGAFDCGFRGAGSLFLPEFTGYQLQAREFKVFIPAGAKNFLFSGYVPQRANVAFVLRYGKEPTRVQPLNEGEYAQSQVSEKIDTAFPRLVSEDRDHFVVHDGGGTLRFSGGNIPNGSTDTGRWLYFRQLNGEPMYDVQGAMDLDMDRFIAGYNAMTWTNSYHPDPIESGAPVVTPPVVVPPVVVPPVVTPPAGLVVNQVSAPGMPLKLDITLTQTAAEVAANPRLSTWVAARIPMGNLFFSEVWFFRTPAGWTGHLLGDIEDAALIRQSQNMVSTTMSPTLDFTPEEFAMFGVEIYFGYRTSNGVFVNKGRIWPK